MNKYVISETSQHVMKLRQLGASVQVVRSQMIYVVFKFNQDIEVEYVYNINKKNKYFLERIKPYPIPIKEFDTADDIVAIIAIDIDQFKNAVKSHKICDFININKNFHKTMMSFEDLFLYYNVPTKYVSKIKENIKEIDAIIKEATTESVRVFFDKEPENL